MNKLNLTNNYIPESGAAHLNKNSLHSGILMLRPSDTFSKKIIKKTNIGSFNISNSGYSKFKNRASFREIIAQSFRSSDLIILNNFNDSLFLKKKLFDKLFGIAGLPIDVEGTDVYTSDRISKNNNLLLKTNVLNSPKFMYKKFLKNAFVKNLGIRRLNENLIQRPSLFFKKRFRRNIHELMYFDNNKKKIVKRQKFRRLFFKMSNKIRGINFESNKVFFNYNIIQKRSILNSRISDSNLSEKNKINNIILSLASRSLKRHLFKLRYKF